MWRVFSRHNDNDYDVDNDDVAPRLTWLMGISGETEQLSSPARALASLSLAAPNFGTFCIRVWRRKKEFTSTLPCLYSYVAFGVNPKLSPAFEVTLTWIGLNLCKRLQKVQRDWNESRDLVPCCPGAQCCHIHRQRGLSLRSCAKQSPDFLWNSNSQLLDYKSHL